MADELKSLDKEDKQRSKSS